MQPNLSAQGYQLQIVNYTSQESLQFALRGIDTVVSTVTGASQVELIKAAVQVGVRRFAPAEFEGLPEMRTAGDALDRGRAAARQWLHYYSQQIESTIFICGVLYERFQPGGLAASLIGLGSGFAGEGDFMMDIRRMTAAAPTHNADNQPAVTICMTAAQDVARFVTRALDLRKWPPVMSMYGERLTVIELLQLVQQIKRQLSHP